MDSCITPDTLIGALNVEPVDVVLVKEKPSSSCRISTITERLASSQDESSMQHNRAYTSAGWIAAVTLSPRGGSLFH
jgi:hypothetical protein